jgi:tRNA(Ile2) C34 agmatinyltransferase TiaS
MENHPVRGICQAPDCQTKFIPNAPHQVYCSHTCMNRTSTRKIAAKRKANGQCPQCGNDVDAGGKLCAQCRDYFREYRREHPSRQLAGGGRQ